MRAVVNPRPQSDRKVAMAGSMTSLGCRTQQIIEYR